jgi:hypothetical protein
MAKVVPRRYAGLLPSYGVMETCLNVGGLQRLVLTTETGKCIFFAKKKQNSSNQYSFPLAPASYYDSNVKSTP